jgi:hypothetical protein
MKRVLLSTVALVVLISGANADGTTVKSKAGVLKFSGKHYIGFVAKDKSEGDDTNKFETRRNYLQVKAYFKEDPKDYFRITLDTHDSEGETNVRLKYAYLYLNNVLPFTGVEIGQAHRPWIDYEEHGGWNYRSISKVFTEAHEGAHLTNSADRGINFKTKLDTFSSELGIFNGEGYHNEQVDDKLSLEWRLTYHALGGGQHKPKATNNYANISFLGQQNSSSHKHKDEDLNWFGLHAVYNQPEFLVSAQYIKTNDAHDKYAGEGYSANGEYRLIPKWNLIGRYDYFEMDIDATEKTRTIAGVAYKYNKNVEFIANVLTEEVDTNGVKSVDDTSIMLTAEINW